MAARGAAVEKKYQFTFNGTSVFGESEEKISFEAFKTFSHRLALKNGSESAMDKTVVKLQRIYALRLKVTCNFNPETFYQLQIWFKRLLQSLTSSNSHDKPKSTQHSPINDKVLAENCIHIHFIRYYAFRL